MKTFLVAILALAVVLNAPTLSLAGPYDYELGAPPNTDKNSPILVDPEELLDELFTLPLLPEDSKTASSANLVEITVSVLIPKDDPTLTEKLTFIIRTEVEKVMMNLWFRPTLIVLTNAMLKNDRLYMRILFADDEGKEMLEELNSDDLENKDEKIKI